jgi:hypothetical protein
MPASITEEEVRMFIVDRSIEDNPVDMVDNYYSQEEILAAMDRCAAAYNEIPPYVGRELKVVNSSLPYKLYLLNGITWQLYLAKLAKLTKEDLNYTAGGMKVELIKTRIEHMRESIKGLKEYFMTMAQQEKIAANYRGAFGQLG